jgi:hypothetical protein
MIEKIEEWFNPVNEFISENSGNVMFWLIILVVGLIFYSFAYMHFTKD